MAGRPGDPLGLQGKPPTTCSRVLPVSTRSRYGSAERAAGILPAEARRIPPRGTFPRAPAVRAVCRRDARQHAVKTALRGPQQRGVRGRLPLGGSIPTRRDQCNVTTGRGTCLVPSRGDLCSGSWRVAPPATRSACSASRPQREAEFYRYPPRVDMIPSRFDLRMDCGWFAPQSRPHREAESGQDPPSAGMRRVPVRGPQPDFSSGRRSIFADERP